MADTTKAQVLLDGPRHLVVQFTNISDGTGESDAQRVDLSATAHATATAAGSAHIPQGKSTLASLSVDEIWYSVQGFEGVRIEWDHTTDSVLAFIPTGDGYIDYTNEGGLHDDGSGGTGDIFFSTVGAAAANDTYTIKIKFKKKWSD